MQVSYPETSYPVYNYKLVSLMIDTNSDPIFLLAQYNKNKVDPRTLLCEKRCKDV